jgi:cob(I)alamin adenosyltransferase
MTRIYTRTGDDGTTGLIGGKRVSKDAPRIEAYGCVDELNATLGVAAAFPLPERVCRIILRVQDDLFRIGASLALPAGMERSEWGVPFIEDADVKALEQEIDDCQASLVPLQRFILPGGSAPGALLHLARTVARRAERRCITLARTEQIDPRIISYLNRVSDLCFVLARCVNQENSQPEIHPSFGKREADLLGPDAGKGT